MWVRNISNIMKILYKDEKPVVLLPGAIADVTLSDGADLARLGLEKYKKSIVIGRPAEIAPVAPKKKKKGAKNGHR